MTSTSTTTNDLALALADSTTMVRRNLRRMVRYPSMTVLLVGQPIIFMLLFVYVFGGTLGTGIGGTGRGAYLDYLVPGILALTISSVSLGTAINVAMDMTGGIVARFRTMAIARVSVLTGHVIGSLVQAALASVVVLAVALALGYRTDAGALDWLATAGVLLAFSFALTWLTVALGLVSGSVETASNIPMVLTILPFLGSGFVPTDSMPAWLRWFGDHQPFTPVIETVRGLLGPGADGGDVLAALVWSAVIAVVGYVWARRLYARDPRR
jgi:ABC-2 type transport system permease protein